MRIRGFEFDVARNFRRATVLPVTDHPSPDDPPQGDGFLPTPSAVTLSDQDVCERLARIEDELADMVPVAETPQAKAVLGALVKAVVTCVAGLGTLGTMRRR